MRKYSLNLDWTFRDRELFFLDPRNFAEAPKVDLPHDFIVNTTRTASAEGGAPNGFFGAGMGIYEKDLEIPEKWAGKRIVLDIDGAYMNAEIFADRELIAMHP